MGVGICRLCKGSGLKYCRGTVGWAGKVPCLGCGGTGEPRSGVQWSKQIQEFGVFFVGGVLVVCGFAVGPVLGLTAAGIIAISAVSFLCYKES